MLHDPVKAESILTSNIIYFMVVWTTLEDFIFVGLVSTIKFWTGSGFFRKWQSSRSCGTLSTSTWKLPSSSFRFVLLQRPMSMQNHMHIEILDDSWHSNLDKSVASRLGNAIASPSCLHCTRNRWLLMFLVVRALCWGTNVFVCSGWMDTGHGRRQRRTS